MSQQAEKPQEFVFSLDSQWGSFHIAGGKDHLIQVLFPNEKRSEDFILAEAANLDPSWLLSRAVEFLQAYLRGEGVIWAERFIPEGTPFQQAVWLASIDIPYGETISYGALAAWVKRPNAARAVGAALAANPLPVLIPCHRIIGADGGLHGFGGGLEMKRALLRHEGVDI